MPESSRLNIATRIHYLFAHYLGDGIDIAAMLLREHYAAEVLLVCDASGEPELRALAAAYREAPALEPEARLRQGAAPQLPAWAQDTSGFGVSRPALGEEPATRRVRWYDPSSWFARQQA